jgi:TRAP-type C4-dicarboxylate transport system permease small subunit
MRLLARLIDCLSVALAYLSGAAFLILSLYITYDAVARAAGLPFSGFSDEISSYTLAIGGAWAMGYALKIGAHVRIDLIVGTLNPRLAHLADLLATSTTALFAGLLAWYGWSKTIEAHMLGTRSITVLQAPLEIPQGMVAIGFTLLAVQALAMFIAGLGGARQEHLPEISAL